MNKPFFTVIIPTYNRETVLPRAVTSVLKQSFKNFELIIVDDGSTDNTDDYLKSIDDPRLVKLTQENLGVGAARNAASEKAQGDWLAFLDSDDEWLEDKLAKQFEYINNNSDLYLVHGEEIWIRNGVRVNPKKKHQKGGGDQFQRSLELCVISPSTAVIKKNIFQHLGKFDSNFVVCEDYDLWLRYTSQYLVGYITDPLIIKYGGHEDQLSRKYKAMDLYRIKAMLKLFTSFELNSEQIITLKNELKNKAQILAKGYEKHQQTQALIELKDNLNAVNLGHFL